MRFFSLLAWLLGFLLSPSSRTVNRAGASRLSPTEVRSILVVRRNRMGDVLSTLPLLKNLRLQFPTARLVFATDRTGASVGPAIPYVNEWIVFARKNKGLGRWAQLVVDAARLQGFDAVLAVKGGYDFRLACLVCWTNAPLRIGFAPPPGHKHVGRGGNFFTHPIPLPLVEGEEHQVETQLRLLRALEVEPHPFFPEDIEFVLPQAVIKFADQQVPSVPDILVNLSCNRPVLFSQRDWIFLLQRMLDSTDLRIGLVSGPEKRQDRLELVDHVASTRIVSIDTPTPLHLAALLQKTRAFVTPEGGAIHLAALTKTPAVILWSEGHFIKWNSRSKAHVYLFPEPASFDATLKVISVERVEAALKEVLWVSAG